eukprot:885040-Pyramimonas_sp.AAC.1
MIIPSGLQRKAKFKTLAFQDVRNNENGDRLTSDPPAVAAARRPRSQRRAEARSGRRAEAVSHLASRGRPRLGLRVQVRARRLGLGVPGIGPQGTGYRVWVSVRCSAEFRVLCPANSSPGAGCMRW